MMAAERAHMNGVPLRLVLPRSAVRRLAELGIYCQPEVSVQYQRLALRYVVRGVESGGATREIGRYVTFAGETGEALPWLQPLDALAPNGVHAIVVAPALVSVEMFRCGQTYELLIARHRSAAEQDGRRPRLLSEVVFRGVNGHLSLELWGKDSSLAGCITPEFFTRAGERMDIPPQYLPAVQAVVRGVCCCSCRHSHYLTSPRPCAG
jgi:hypothetical protein